MSSLTQQQWQELVDSHPEANFLQSWQWGEVNAKQGHKVIRQTVEVGGQVVGGWQGIVKKAKRGRYLEIAGGPLIDWSNTQTVNQMTRQLKKVAEQESVAFVRVRPQILENTTHLKALTGSGFKKAPFHLHAEHTNVLDLSPTEEGLLSGMRRQTRYEVRRADKLEIEVSWSNDQQSVEEFYDLQQITAKRQRFITSSKKFLSSLVEEFGDNARVYRAEKDGQLLNLALVLFSGHEADYFEAASTTDARKYPGSYGLVWRVIRDAKSLGKSRYNLWGIAYSDDPSHRYAGVTTFKRGFGGQDTTYTPAHDLVINRFRYAINWIIETARRKKRKL